MAEVTLIGDIALVSIPQIEVGGLFINDDGVLCMRTAFKADDETSFSWADLGGDKAYTITHQNIRYLTNKTVVPVRHSAIEVSAAYSKAQCPPLGPSKGDLAVTEMGICLASEIIEFSNPETYLNINTGQLETKSQYRVPRAEHWVIRFTLSKTVVAEIKR